jgi:hypothetical protein
VTPVTTNRMMARKTIAQFVMQASNAMELTGTLVVMVTTPPKEPLPVPHAHSVTSVPQQVPCQRLVLQGRSRPPLPPGTVVWAAQARRIARTQPIQPPVPTQRSMEMVTTATHAQPATSAQEGLPADAMPQT